MRNFVLISIAVWITSSSSAQVHFPHRLGDAAMSLTAQRVRYDPRYFSIAYPNGDVPADRGVCTDVIIRANRKMGIDLQKEVHEDMRSHFYLYPKNWSMTTTDTNIDHRRVPNLMKFFSRQGKELPITQNADDYKTGDIVCWSLQRGMTHIGVVVDKKSADGKRNLIVHNIGSGQEVADCLFTYPIIGHYQYRKQ